ncbi:septation ring formation regulator EzrA [Psychrobacillus sp. Sa2BUA9]|uniref:Septation ring formation regulator EzrA n=1 Tax=Psychrobacillus faecigallinarum TaxID=2762235 RepID=A0ABR8R6W7_9BACI|nr:septation ring formation regulator EzrA [Psychrobacillus faecigallinarum]MBD7943539.1 septation ring formation regulator EzrA [Psychrobacillus faecigallinarum]QGM29564.1 septation ring formation regulator EzrA [Bacillus sp. N3536]
MRYIIPAVIVLLVIAIIAFIIRKKHHTEIARLEHEKHQIQNKPILEEMTKVKQLNMNGQTEEMFERWRNTWTEVMDVHMPKIDVLLFDAEEYVDKFLFMKATKIEKELQILISSCDEKMSGIIKELEELIGSEEKNRIEIEQLKEQHRAARKTLLAHQYSFGEAAPALEAKLESFLPLFEEFDHLTDTGNYLSAREIVINIQNEGQKFFHKIHEIPTLLSEIQHKIPATIHELRNGQKEMEASSYYLQHLEMTKKLDGLEAELGELKASIVELEVSKPLTRVEEIKEEIETFYDLLEKEVLAKKYVDNYKDQTAIRLKEVTSATKAINEEATYVQQSYRLPEKEAEIPQSCLKELEELNKKFSLLAQRVEEEKSAYSSLQEELNDIAEEIDRLYEEQDRFANRLKNLRIDENKAREKLDDLKVLLHDTDRMIQKANIPGIPEEMDVRLEEAEEHIYVAMQSLQEVPLNMTLVDGYLEKAEACMEEVHQKAKEMLENVELTEKIIQYGNRYRATHPNVHARLLEAEEAFRQLRYAKALEDAATAVEEVEPGALKKIEMMIKEAAWRT